MNEAYNATNKINDLELKLVFYSNSGEGALSIVRLLGPANQIGVKVINGYDESGIKIESVKDGNIVIIQRDVCRDLDAVVKILGYAKKQNKPVVMDLDDQLFVLPENHPDRISHYYTEALLPMFQVLMEADLITVATPILHEFILPINPNVEIIPNYLNDKLWEFKEPINIHHDSDILSIGYMGGDSHKPDIEMILPVLLKLADEYGRNIQFKFWGIEPPSLLTPYSTVDWYPPKSNSYSDFVSYFQTQYADIVISPLCDNYFNSCKSPLKFLEYSALGLPGVYSNLSPYSAIVDHGEDGFLATSLSEWETNIKKLINNPELRITFAKNAQKKIRKNWLLSLNAEKQFLLYKKTILENDKKYRFENKIFPVIKSITKQNYDWQKNNKQQLDDQNVTISTLTQKLKLQEIDIYQIIDKNNDVILELNAKIKELEKVVQHQIQDNLEELKNLKLEFEEKKVENKLIIEKLERCEEEVLFYATSKSWALTRPFRRFLKIVKRNPK